MMEDATGHEYIVGDVQLCVAASASGLGMCTLHCPHALHVQGWLNDSL